MSLKPTTIEKLISDYPETTELIAFIAETADELNRLTDIENIEELMRDPAKAAIEHRARKLAYDKLCLILKPFIEAAPKRESGPKIDEYGVDVDTLDKNP